MKTTHYTIRQPRRRKTDGYVLEDVWAVCGNANGRTGNMTTVAKLVTCKTCMRTEAWRRAMNERDEK